MSVVTARPRAALWLVLLLLFAPAAGAVDLQAHRGGRGLMPENTLPAFAHALELGVDTLELDTAVTRDDAVVVTHDLRLNPNLVRDADGRHVESPGAAVRSMTLAELQRLDVGRLRPGSRYAAQFPDQRAVDGTRIPTLAQVFALLRERRDGLVRFNIETKLTPLEPALAPEPEAFVRALLAVIDAHGMRDRVSLQSFDWRTLRAAQRLAPQIPTVCLTARQSWLDNAGDPRWTAGLAIADHGGSVPRLVKAAGCTTWSPYFGDLDEAALAEARALGLKVVVWTVNEPPAIERMLAMGVDGLISDRPDRVRAAMAAAGLPLPPAARTRAR